MTTVPNPASRVDVENSFERPLTTDEQRVVPNWLRQAWTILTATVPGVDTRLAAGGLTEDAVVQVLVAMVERKIRNPDGLRSWNGDDYTETIDSALSSGQIYPTPAEITRLSVRVPTAGMYLIPFA